MIPRRECPDCGADNTEVLGFYCEHEHCPMALGTRFEDLVEKASMAYGMSVPSLDRARNDLLEALAKNRTA